MAPPRPLIDDVTAEILLRLPPDEPEHLFRAALVCKPWLRIICDAGFRRAYRDFHGAPPLLGFLHRLMVLQGDPPARFASATSVPEFPHPGSDALDCRHGRVLVHMLPGFLVWDPVTGDRHLLPPEPKEMDWLIYSAAVLCAADGCDHLDCRGGPFRVVFAATHEHRDIILASVYSSETGAWSAPVRLDNTCETYARHVLREGRATPFGTIYYTPYLQPRRGALVGDAVYFTVREGNGIAKYDLGKDSLSMIDPPTTEVYYVALMAMENNTSLGFACIQGSSLYTWSRKVDTEEAAEWVQYRVIQLEKTIPVANPVDQPFQEVLGIPVQEPFVVVGFAEGVDVVFVSSGVGLFTIKLSSGQVKKVDGPGEYFSVLPYMSFYLPETGNGGGHDAAGLLHNT